MVDLSKRPRLVGNFIRQRREALGLSQRALGLLFTPPVTTQFISNVERGVTPLPPAHVPILAQALKINDAEIMSLLEKEYTLKLSDRIGKTGDGDAGASDSALAMILPSLQVSKTDYDFIKSVYDAYKQADPKTRQAFATVCETILSVPKPPSS